MRRTWIAVWLPLAAALACAGAGTGRRAAEGPSAAPGALEAAMIDAERAAAAGRLDEARARWGEAARLAPADPRPHLGLARVEFAAARPADGIASASRAVALRESPEALGLRARLLGVSRRFDEAAADLERAVALAPGDGAAWLLLAAVEVNRGGEAEARWAFEAGARAIGEGPAVERVWADLLAMTPDPAQPQESLERCMRGTAAQLAGRWAEAEHEQRNALRYTSTYVWCVVGIAESEWRLGQPDPAERILRGAIAAYPAGQERLRADAQGKLAALLVSQRKAAGEAVELARAALAARGERAALLDALGRACELAGDAACARDAWGRLARRAGLPGGVRATAEERVRILGDPALRGPGAPASAAAGGPPGRAEGRP